MAFDENSFSQDAFDPLAWLFDIVQVVVKFFRQLFVRTDLTDVIVARETNEIWVKRKIL